MKKLVAVLFVVMGVLYPFALHASDLALDNALSACKLYDAHSSFVYADVDEIANVKFDVGEIRQLLKSGNLPTKEQFSCVAFYATYHHNPQALQVLTDFVQIAKMDVDTRDNQGYTAFKRALTAGFGGPETIKSLQIAETLYRLGSQDVNAVDRFGNTVLHLTVESTPENWPTKLDMWVKAGVHDYQNEMGQTAWQLLDVKMARIAKDNRLGRGLLASKVPTEYKKAKKVLQQTQEYQQARYKNKLVKQIAEDVARFGHMHR